MVSGITVASASSRNDSRARSAFSRVAPRLGRLASQEAHKVSGRPSRAGGSEASLMWNWYEENKEIVLAIIAAIVLILGAIFGPDTYHYMVDGG